MKTTVLVVLPKLSHKQECLAENAERQPCCYYTCQPKRYGLRQAHDTSTYHLQQLTKLEQQLMQQVFRKTQRICNMQQLLVCQGESLKQYGNVQQVLTAGHLCHSACALGLRSSTMPMLLRTWKMARWYSQVLHSR